MTGMSQVIQVMGAMVIFSLILLNMNRFILLNDMVLLQNEYEQVAMAAGQSLINEGRVMAFDDSSVDETDSDSTLTTYDKLGPEGSENRQDVNEPPYDDIDDFNGFTETKVINNINYNIAIDVCYVQKSDLDKCYNGTTDHKLMTVTVNNNYMDHPIRLQYVKSYY